MNLAIGFILGAFVGATLGVLVLSLLFASTRTHLPPEVAERLREQQDAARWN
jgi:hypothetical protein